MSEGVDRLDNAFPVAASIALDLLRLPEVAEAWLRPSCLPEMSVGALACHLGRQPVRAAEVLPAATEVAPLDSADDHYARAAWVTSTSPDDPANDRSTDDDEALLGPTALHDRATGALETLRGLLGSGAARDVVFIPWQGLVAAPCRLPAHPTARGRRPQRRPGSEHRRPDAGVPRRDVRAGPRPAGAAGRPPPRSVRADRHAGPARACPAHLRLLATSANGQRRPTGNVGPRAVARASFADNAPDARASETLWTGY